MLAGRDADRARGLLAQLAERGEVRIDLVEPRGDGAQQALARFGRRHAARGAGQQPQSEPLLQPADSMAERGLRDAELGCGPREAPFPRHGDEREQVVEVLARHL